MRKLTLLLLLLIVGCSPSFADLKAERELLLEEFTPLYRMVALAETVDNPDVRDLALKETPYKSYGVARARLDKIKNRLEAIDREIGRP